jgi:hypothetical protein
VDRLVHGASSAQAQGFFSMMRQARYKMAVAKILSSSMAPAFGLESADFSPVCGKNNIQYIEGLCRVVNHFCVALFYLLLFWNESQTLVFCTLKISTSFQELHKVHAGKHPAVQFPPVCVHVVGYVSEESQHRPRIQLLLINGSHGRQRPTSNGRSDCRSLGHQLAPRNLGEHPNGCSLQKAGDSLQQGHQDPAAFPLMVHTRGFRAFV